MSFQRIVGFVKDRLGTDAPADQGDTKERTIRLATIAALLEIAYADESLTLKEERALLEHAREMFGLDEDETRELIEAADEIRRGTIDHWSLTSLLRKNCTLEERIRIVKSMWRIVYSDDRLHEYEGYLVRKLADLLGLEHHVMINAKLEVQKEIGWQSA